MIRCVVMGARPVTTSHASGARCAGCDLFAFDLDEHAICGRCRSGKAPVTGAALDELRKRFDRNERSRRRSALARRRRRWLNLAVEEQVFVHPRG